MKFIEDLNNKQHQLMVPMTKTQLTVLLKIPTNETLQKYKSQIGFYHLFQKCTSYVYTIKNVFKKPL